MAEFLTWDMVKAGADVLKYGALIGGASSLATWYLTKRSYDTGDLRTRVEVVGFEPELQPDGTYLVDFPTHGDQMNLSQLIGLPRLEKRIVAATRRTKNGFLVLKDGRSQRLMMAIFEDHITGNDDRTHTEAMDGVPTRRVDIVFAPAYFYEADEDVSMIRIIKISERFARLLRNKAQQPLFRARLARKSDFMKWAIAIAEQADSSAQAASGTAFIWRTTLKATLGGAEPAEVNQAA